MITEFKVQNFLSIKNELKINLEASAGKKLPKNVISDRRQKLLKSTAIYGANASGKSNIVRAFFTMWQLVKFSHSFNIDTKIAHSPFKLDSETINSPSKFEITFIKNDTKYQYGFTFERTKIVEEYLHYWKLGNRPRKATIFTRSNTINFAFNVDKSKQDLIKSQMGENVLYLSRATALNYEATKEAYDFIVNDIVINYNPSWMNYTVEHMYSNPELKAKILDILQKADFGGITDIRLKKERKKVSGVEFEFGPEGSKFNQISEKEQDVYDVKLVHTALNGEQVEFDILEESEGTRKALSLFGPIFDTLETGKVMIIDELELSLHPNITEFIIRLFHSATNKTNAQIIFTTHNTNLLGKELLRRDQVNICSKEPNKGTELRSLLEYNLREDADFERVYLTGRVGGLPFIDETILE